MKSYSGLVIIIAIIFGGYCTICFLTWFFQDKLIFFPFKEYDATPANLGIEFEEVTLATHAGDSICSWSCRTSPQPRIVILFLNGNAGNMSHRLERLPMAKALNADILLVDYPGYGRSTGKPSEQSLNAAALAGYQYLVSQKGVEPSRIILYGESIGSSAALHLASQERVGGVVVESGFTSLAEVGSSHYGWLPVKYLLKYRFPSRDYIKQIGCPVLVSHSSQDDVTPFSMGEELFELAAEPKRFVRLSGGHNDRDFLNDSSWLASMIWLCDEVEKQASRTPSSH
jgi:uncharacterized protein